MAISVNDQTKLALLYPPFADLLGKLIIKATSSGLPIGIFEGLRTFERQAQLYAIGRDANGNKTGDPKTVTNAKPGYSFHAYGLAGDIVFCIPKPNGKGFTWTWERPEADWKSLADMGIGLGLESLYYSPTFKEAPHFQLSMGYKPIDLLPIYKQGGLKLLYQTVDQKKV